MKMPDGKDMYVPSRTPEVIKKGLECCARYCSCHECPYSDERCATMLPYDALAYIQKLEAERDEYKRKLNADWRELHG